MKTQQHAHHLGHLADALDLFLLRHLLHAQAERDVLLHALVREQRVALEHHAEPAVARLEVVHHLAVDAQLARYREMRDFSHTAEPRGGSKKTQTSDGLPFVIQKHAAKRLHYDFRLGWNGVLKSWAVTKGPSYVVADKRLAVQVEDHPLDYADFEGVIPAGEYGGGTVMVWDRGTWEPEIEDPSGSLRSGKLKFRLDGEKLNGSWALVRMGGRTGEDGKNWLLIKHDDEAARPARKYDVASIIAAPLSGVQQKMKQSLLLFVPVGIACGLLLAAAVLGKDFEAYK